MQEVGGRRNEGKRLCREKNHPSPHQNKRAQTIIGQLQINGTKHIPLATRKKKGFQV